MSKYIINLDLHGGDFAPQSVLEGALIAQNKNSSIKFNQLIEFFLKYQN